MEEKKEYYTEELEKLPTDKMKAIKNQKKKEYMMNTKHEKD